MKKTWQKELKNIMGVITVVTPIFLIIPLVFIYPDTPVEELKMEDIRVVETCVKDYNRHILNELDYSKLIGYCSTSPRVKDDQIVEFTYEEAQLLMYVARAEAGTSLEGQKWVMRTIVNRMQNDNFPDTLIDVITVNGQFDVVKTGRYKTVELNENSHLALAAIESGWDETDGALWFEASTNTPNSWHAKNLQFIKEVEGQRYYK